VVDGELYLICFLHLIDSVFQLEEMQTLKEKLIEKLLEFVEDIEQGEQLDLMDARCFQRYLQTLMMFSVGAQRAQMINFIMKHSVNFNRFQLQS
jgi:hypothetical protein